MGSCSRLCQHRKSEASWFCGFKEKCCRFMAASSLKKPALHRGCSAVTIGLLLPRTGVLAYKPLLTKAGIPDTFMAVSNCTHQPQQPGSRFPSRDMVYCCFQNQIFLEFFVCGQSGKIWLWSETPVSGLPFSHTSSANGEA